MTKRKMSGVSKLIWLILIIGFAAMEFPGVLFFHDKVEPFIFGLPFIYGYIIILWAIMCIVLFYAYRVNWGEGNSEGGEKK